jgi:hypothetical protein
LGVCFRALTAISEGRVVPPSLTSVEERRAQHLGGQAQHSLQALLLDYIAHRLYALVRVDVRSHQPHERSAGQSDGSRELLQAK